MKPVCWMRAISLMLAVVCVALVFDGCKRQSGNASDSNASANASPTPTPVSVPEQPDAPSYLAQGDEQLKNDQDAEAAESFRRAVEKDKDFAEGYLHLGLAYDALNRDEDADKAYKSAIEAYEKRVRKDSKDARAHYEMGQAYYRLG